MHEIYDVIQLGRGPVGMTSAALLAQAGHTVALVERHTGLYGHPRAGHIDHEIARILQSVDSAAPALADAEAPMDYVWKNAEGEVLIEFAWGAKGISGYRADYMMFMPLVDQALADRLAREDKIHTMCGWEAAEMIEHGDHVELVLHRTERVDGAQTPVITGEEKRIRGRYLLASDGANSCTRRRLGIEQDDLGFNERWLVVDAKRKRDLQRFDPDCGQICDPRRPVTILPLGKRHRRWEWYMFEHETNEEFLRPERAWALLAEQGVTPDDVEIIRQLPYTFSGKIARRWNEQRVFLMGDAAHTMPPFMGQGMCSGIRDAANLSWKLSLVVRGICDPEILETYQEERLPHVRDWTLISIESGKLPCTVDPEAARQRDRSFREGWHPPMPDFPKLVGGVLHRRDDGTLAPLAGELGVQGRVLVSGRTDLLDAFLAPGAFQVLSTVGRPQAVLDARQRSALAALGAQFCWIGGPDVAADAVDVEGTYAEYCEKQGVEVLLVRPDYYVFAGCSMADLPAVVDDLLRQLRFRSAPEASGFARADKQTA